MAYFYGWTNDEIEALTVDQFHLYWIAITTIEAQETRRLNGIQDWSHMQKGAREDLDRRLFSDAYPDSLKEKKQVSMNDFAKFLKG